MPEKNLPLVFVDFALLNGSLRDPIGKEGVASLTLSMLLRGTQKKSAMEFHEALDTLGGEMHLGKFKESLRIYGVVLAEKLDAFLDLLQEMLTQPAFPEQEFKKIKSQFRASLLDEQSSDDDMTDRRFQEYGLWGNPYGRITAGSLESLDAISLDDLKNFHQTIFLSDDFIVGATGNFKKAALEKRLKTILSHLPKGSLGRLNADAPVFEKQKKLVFLDKANRTQCQIMVGAPGVGFTDDDYFSVMIANHVFGGGSFSSRLMKEIREKRGWSYGAYSWFRSGRKPLYFAMQSVPSNKDTIPALNLMLKLFESFAKKGITKAEFDFAKNSLVSQGAFLQDTVRKRLDNKVTEAVLELQNGFYDSYQKKLKSVTYARVQKVIKKRFQPTNIFAVILGTYQDLEAELQKLKFKKIWKVPFDQKPQALETLDVLNFKASRTNALGK